MFIFITKLERKGKLRQTHGIKVETVRYSPVCLVGQDSTTSVYSTISSLLQFTVDLLHKKHEDLKDLI